MALIDGQPSVLLQNVSKLIKQKVKDQVEGIKEAKKIAVATSLLIALITIFFVLLLFILFMLTFSL